MDALLALPQDRPSWKLVSRLRCVLHVTETEQIRILHPSFHDYLSDRCRDHPWSIDFERHNRDLALHCIELLDNELRENICDMTLPYLSRKRTLSEALSYACKFWIEHICLVSDVTDDIVNQIDDFLVKHLLHWMEAMAILNSHDDTIRLIHNLKEWHRVCPPYAYFPLTFTCRDRHEVIRTSTSSFMMVIAVDSTLQIPSRCTLCCFTR